LAPFLLISPYGNQSTGEKIMATQNNQPSQEESKDPQKLSKGVSVDPETQVRESEDASLQDETYSFDEDNTGIEEYHDAGDADDFDIDNDDDFVQ
jgi:hypothetical protein